MDVVFIRSNLQKLDLIPLLYPKAHLFENIIYIIVKHRPSVLRRKYQVVQQFSDVMTLVDVLAHPSRLRPKGRGMCAREGAALAR